MPRQYARKARGLACLLVALWGCDDNTTATDAGVDTGTSPPTDTGTTPPADAGAVGALEALLDDPSALRSTAPSRPGFDDPEVTALSTRLPAARTPGATPDAFGFVGDAVESLPAARAILDARPRQYHVTVSLLRPESATGEGVVAATLTATDGVMLARRVEGAEPSDAFQQRTARPLGPEAMRSLSLDARLAPGDQDAFTAVVYAAPAATVGLTLRVGAASFPVTVSAEPSGPETFEVAEGVLATVGVARDPGGPCTITRGLVLAHTYQGSAGLVGELRGVLHRGPTLTGYVRGVFGRARRAGREVLYLQAIGTDGAPLWFGEAAGFVPGQRRAGRLSGAGGDGSFIARASAPMGPALGASGLSPFSLELHTDCR